MTAQTVTDEVLGGIARKQWDLFRRVREGVLDPNLVSSSLQAIIEGRTLATPSPNFRFDKLSEGWELVSNKSRRLTESSKLEFVSFLRPGEGSVSGETLQRRAREMLADLSQEDAEFLLDHPELLPQCPKGVYYIPFVGTVWRRPHGALFVPCLIWYDDRWHLPWRGLDDDWSSDDTFVRPCN